MCRVKMWLIIAELITFLVLVNESQSSIVTKIREPGTPEENGIEDGKSSLVFVFDTTGSMYNDLKQLREGAEMILNTALEESGIIGDFVFVPFHDPAVGPATVTRDKEVFKTALGVVSVYGGGDCPEKSLGGIQLALSVSGPRSFVYVFTDATAGDHRLVGKVLDAVQRKQSQVVFVLTGHCNDLDKPSYRVYQQIAAASSGQVFNLNKTSVHKVLDFVKSSIKGRTVNLGSSVNPAGYNMTQEIPVDSTLGEVTVSVSGAKPQITVVNPSGEQLTGPPKLVTTLDLSEIMVVKVMQPEPGNWTITVGSEEDYSVKVVGLSNLTFNHGFSVEPPQSMAETSYRPLEGTYNHMMISLSQAHAPVKIDYAEIITLSGKTLFELPLTAVDGSTYVASAFIPPDEFFYIAINGRDENDNELRRIGATAVQAKLPDVPYLSVLRKIEAHPHSRVVLKCRAESLVPLTAMWTKDAAKIQGMVSSLQTTTIEYVIDDMTEEAVGTYRCVAKNIAGTSRALTEVTLIVEPPLVSFEPRQLSLELGGSADLSCTVFSEALLLNFQIISTYNEAREVSDIAVEPNIEGVYSYNISVIDATEDDTGNHTCVAVNRGGTSNATAAIQVISKPTAQILGSHELSAPLHSVVTLYCVAQHSGALSWLHNGTSVREMDVNGTHTDFLAVNVTDDGNWTCRSKRREFEASDSVNISVVIKPTVTIQGSKAVTVLNGTSLEIVCEVQAKPQPRIVWYRGSEEKFLNHTTTAIDKKTHRSVLQLNSSALNVQGSYFCVGENSAGIHQDSVDVTVRREMRLLKGFTDISVQLYDQVILQCNVDAYPPPTITWHHNSTELTSRANVVTSEDDTTVHISRVEFDDLGTYSCLANNSFESMKVNGTLSVIGLDAPVLSKDQPSKRVVKHGESTIFTCRALKGNPEPTLKWEYKSLKSDNYVPALMHNMTKGDQKDFILNNVTVSESGIYKCVAENIVGRDEFDVELVVYYPPQFTPAQQPNVEEKPLEVAAGESITFSCDTVGLPPPVVTWNKDGHSLYGKHLHTSGSTLIINNVTEYDSGLFTCTVKNPIGSVHKNFSLLVYVPPKISPPTVATEQEILEGQLVELPCEATGVPAPEVLWHHNGASVIDGNKFIDEFGIRFVANLTDFGDYTCVAKNRYGNTSISYSLFIWVPPYIEPSPEMSIYIKKDSNASIQCDVVGFPVPNIHWEFQNELLKQNTTDLSFNDFGNLYITNASSKHEGAYACVAGNIAGVARKLTYLNVNEPPSILEDDYKGPYLATNMDTALTIACRTTGKPKPYVLWSKDGNYIYKDVRYEVEADGTLVINSPTEDMSGNYTCSAKNSVGAVNRTVEVRVYSLPIQTQSEESRPVVTVREHTDTDIECPTPASHTDTVKWYKDAVLVSTGNLKIANISREDQSTYACVVSNAVGSAYSAISLSIEWPPRFTDNIDDSEKSDSINEEMGIHDKVNETGDKIITLEEKRDNLATNIEGKAEIVEPTKDNNPSSEKTGRITEEVAGNHGKDDSMNVKSNSTHQNIKNSFENIRGAVVADDTERKGDPTSIGKTDENDSHNDGLQNDRNAVETTSTPAVNKDTNKMKAGKNNMKNNNQRKSFEKGKNIVQVVKGDDTYLDCSVDAKPIPQIKWLFNSKPIVFEKRERLKLMNVTARNAGSYKCVVGNSHGTVIKEFRLDVLEPPFIAEFDVLDVLLMEGVNATLECDVKGTPEPVVQWTYNNSNWHVDKWSVSATNISAQAAGLVRCDARSQAGAAHVVYRVSVVSGAKIEDIVVYKDGEGSSVNNTLEVELGSHIRIACKAVGEPTPSIQWLRNGKLLSENRPDIAYADLKIDGVQTSHAGGYSCVVGNEGGINDRKIRLEVLESPRIFQTLFNSENSKGNTVNLEVLSGQAYYLHCHAYGNPAPELYWFRDGLPLMLFDDSMVSTEFGEVLEVRRAAHEQAGNYTCVARNKVGDTSLVYLLDVLVPPPQPKEASRAVTVRVGRPLTLACPADGVPPPLVAWHKHPYTEVGGDTPRVRLQDNNVTLHINNTHVSDSGNYSCTMTNKVGTTEATFDVTVEKPPTIAGDVSGDNVETHEVALRRSIVLKCEADGHPLPRISWLKDTQELSDSLSNINRVLGNSLLAIWSVTPRDAGQYICVVENSAGTQHRRYNVYVKVPGKWSSWGKWSFCNVTCGSGHQQRSRSCQYIDENNNVIDKSSSSDKFVLDESACKGPSEERRKCHMPPCEEEDPLPGQWSVWSRWAACSASCGAGTQARTRRCKGRRCEGDNVQIRKCPNLPKCNNIYEEIDNEVYHTNEELNENNAYSPEAVFEMEPEIVKSHYSQDVEEFYLAAGSRQPRVFYDVKVTTNLDGSERGPCGAGYSHDAAAGTCHDIDECVVESNECHATQVCVNVAGAYRCTCSPGLLSLGAGLRCMDINECTQAISGCEYACVNVVGGYVCACPGDMRLHADKHHCYTAHAVSSAYRRPDSYEDEGEYLSASIEYPARYKHMKT